MAGTIENLHIEGGPEDEYTYCAAQPQLNDRFANLASVATGFACGVEPRFVPVAAQQPATTSPELLEEHRRMGTPRVEKCDYREIQL